MHAPAPGQRDGHPRGGAGGEAEADLEDPRPAAAQRDCRARGEGKAGDPDRRRQKPGPRSCPGMPSSARALPGRGGARGGRGGFLRCAGGGFRLGAGPRARAWSRALSRRFTFLLFSSSFSSPAAALCFGGLLEGGYPVGRADSGRAVIAAAGEADRVSFAARLRLGLRLLHPETPAAPNGSVQIPLDPLGRRAGRPGRASRFHTASGRGTGPSRLPRRARRRSRPAERRGWCRRSCTSDGLAFVGFFTGGAGVVHRQPGVRVGVGGDVRDGPFVCRSRPTDQFAGSAARPARGS